MSSLLSDGVWKYVAAAAAGALGSYYLISRRCPRPRFRVYVPSENDDSSNVDGWQQLIHENSFALIVTTTSSGATHLTQIPILLDSDAGFTFWGHVARANPHAEAMQETGAATRLLFFGPHAAIPASCYATSPQVGTWNYATVHVDVRATTHRDMDTVRPFLDKLSHSVDGAWQWNSYAGSLVDEIVVFSFEPIHIMYKRKMSQNKGEADKEAVRQYLSQQESAHEECPCSWVKQYIT
jgi:transcriptional regulator